MGIGYCPTPRELIYHNLDYGNTKAIQGLLRFYYNLREELDYRPNFELVCILTDIDMAMKESGLTARQKKVLPLYMQGHTGESIGNDLGITRQGVEKHITLVCNKLSNHLCFS